MGRSAKALDYGQRTYNRKVAPTGSDVQRRSAIVVPGIHVDASCQIAAEQWQVAIEDQRAQLGSRIKSVETQSAANRTLHVDRSHAVLLASSFGAMSDDIPSIDSDEV